MELQPSEPRWLGNIAPTTGEADQRPFLIPGVRVKFAPIGPKAFRAAAAASRAVLIADRDDGEEPDLEEASDEIARALIRRGIVEWEGITADAAPANVTDKAVIEAFISDARFFLPAQAAYVTPYLLRDAEGKGSSGSPAGTGTKATPEPDIARDADRTGSGAATRKRTNRHAPTSSTSRKRKPAKPFGK